MSICERLSDHAFRLKGEEEDRPACIHCGNTKVEILNRYTRRPVKESNA